jgi:dTDP-4-amino-4,6-dideoxygalactose transaminase
MTFTAAAEVIIHLGGIPVFIDSEPETGNMNWRHLDKILRNNKNITEKLKAVIPVHLAGYPMDMDPIRDIIPDYTVIIEDSAHAFPSFTEKGPAGLLGDIGVFSFYATKTITTGEGGMVVTRNKRFYERIKLMRLHGIDRTVWNRYSSSAGSRAWEYDVLAPGYKYNLTDIASAIGNEQLNIALKLLDKRKKISEIYINELSDIKELQLPPSADGHAWHLFILRLGSSDKRDFLALKLKENNIGSSVHFIPLHKMTYWKNEFHLEEKDYPEAEKFFAGAISIPIWPGLRWKDQKRIIKIIRENINE